MAETTSDLVALIHRGNFQELQEELLKWRPSEVATTLSELGPEDQLIAFRILPRPRAAAVFEYLRPEDQRRLLKAMGGIYGFLAPT